MSSNLCRSRLAGIHCSAGEVDLAAARKSGHIGVVPEGILAGPGNMHLEAAALERLLRRYSNPQLDLVAPLLSREVKGGEEE